MFLGLSSVLLTSDLCFKDNSWNGFRPLRATQQEVEKVLRHQDGAYDARFPGRFTTRDGYVVFTYSRGGCGSLEDGRWNVPESTVILISFFPKNPSQLSDLKIDLRTFTKQPVGGVNFLEEYVDANRGLAFTVDTETGKVGKIEYLPTSMDFKKLTCRKE